MRQNISALTPDVHPDSDAARQATAGHRARRSRNGRARTLGGSAALALAVASAPFVAGCSSSTAAAPLTSTADADQTATKVAAGNTIASSSFDVKRDGFSFPNYDNSAAPINMTPASMQKLFGDEVCARINADGCTLTAPAAAWMTVLNSAMDGGHCFGMATLATLFYENKIQRSSYGASSTYALKDEGKVQTLIAQMFATQATNPEATTGKAYSVSDIITQLRQGWAQHREYLLAIRTLDGSAGHAITPVALRNLAGGKVGLVVYDNNYPGEPRTVELDPAANSWKYTTSADPTDDASDFVGNAGNPMMLYTPAAALQTQDCPFCRDSSDPSVYVTLDQKSAQAGVTMTVTDPAGQPLSGVKSVPWMSDDAASGSDDPDLLLRVPDTRAFRVTITGSKVKGTAPGVVTVIGRGWSDQVAAVQLSQGESDSIDVNPSNGRFTYRTTDAESPVLSNTVDEGDASYTFAFKGATVDADGGSFDVATDRRARTERITSHGTGGSVMKFAFVRIDKSSSQVFSTDSLSLADGQSLLADYGVWKGNGKPLTVGVDDGDNGSIDRTVHLRDQ